MAEERGGDRRDGPAADGGGSPPAIRGGGGSEPHDASASEPSEPGLLPGGNDGASPPSQAPFAGPGGCPTFPAEGGCGRYDSDAGGHDPDDDLEEDDDDDDSLDEDSLDDGDLGGSSFTITRRPDWSGRDLALADRPGGGGGARDGGMAASAPALLAGLPPTHRPFQPRLGGSASGLDAPRPSPWRDRDFGGGGPSDRPSMPLCSLPSDALHAVSTYCRPRDWASVSCASRGLGAAGREVVARVFRHAGRCALEVGSAWARGEHADARELAALYVRRGVPIYPAPRGHGYHTLVWRMGVELAASGDGGAGDEAAGSDADDGAAPDDATGPGGRDGGADRFYLERHDPPPPPPGTAPPPRERPGGMTYVERKAAYWKRERGMTQGVEPAGGRRGGPRRMSAAGEGRTDRYHGAGRLTRRQSYSGQSSFRGGGGPDPARTDAGSPAADAEEAPRMTLRVHRHLADSHLYGCPAVDDRSGTMDAPPLSMSADFFHPTWEGARCHARAARSDAEADRLIRRERIGERIREALRGMHELAMGGGAMDLSGHLMAAEELERQLEERERGYDGEDEDYRDGDYRGGEGGDVPLVGIDYSDGDRTYVNNNGVPVRGRADRGGGGGDSPYRAAVRAFVSSLAGAGRGRRATLDGAGGAARGAGPGPASDVRIEAYGHAVRGHGRSPKGGPKTEGLDDDIDSGGGPGRDLNSDPPDDAERRAVADERRRAERHRLLLDEHLSLHDLPGHRESLLDYWDGLFPSTAGIHFHDRTAPVPRMSSLPDFLSRPCPKAIGPVRCEIERVRVPATGRRVKGRLFPSYEYRLFVRDGRSAIAGPSGPAPPGGRVDTVLAVARSGPAPRDDAGSDGPGAAPSRRGVTSYHVVLPRRSDVDSHWRSANRPVPAASGAVPPPTAPRPRPGEDGPLSVSPAADRSRRPVEVGRLQSNFIGTEFQIFVPRTGPDRTKKGKDGREGAGDVADGSGPPAPPAERGRGRRGSGVAGMIRRASLTLTRRGSPSGGADRAHDASSPEPSPRAPRRGSLTRRLSFASARRTSRRAVANEAGSPPPASASSGARPGEVEAGCVTYTANLLGNRPRIMDVCIPRLGGDGRAECGRWRPEGARSDPSRDGGGGGEAGAAESSMLERFKAVQQERNAGENNGGGGGGNDQPGPPAQDPPAEGADAAVPAGQSPDRPSPDDDPRHGLMVLQNRPPWWNVELNAFVLNFGGRVKVASVKNFQLVERPDSDHVMQFGRIEGRHSFTVDFEWPLSPVQAFGIAISSLQSKISFG